MNIDELSTEYENDSKIDTLNLENEFRNSALLHAKYLRKWAIQRYLLERFKGDMKKLRVEKFEHYSQGPSKETRHKNWKMPASGVLLKSNIPMYMEGDSDILEVQSTIDNAQIIVDELEKIVGYVAFRAKTLEALLALRKFEAGA